jgi:hypothetical protein
MLVDNDVISSGGVGTVASISDEESFQEGKAGLVMISCR